MSTLRAIATLLILVVIALLSIFYMNLRGFEKVGRINEYVLYYNQELDTEDTVYSGYYVKLGFEEIPLSEALESDTFTNEEVTEINEMISDRSD